RSARSSRLPSDHAAMPFHRPTFQSQKSSVERVSQDRNENDTRIHVGAVHRAFFVRNKETKTFAADNHLRGGDENQRDRKADAQAGHDIGRGAGQDNLPQDAPAAEAERPSGVDQRTLNVSYTLDGIDQNRPHTCVHSDGDDHRITDTEDQNGDGNNRHRRHWPKKLDQYLEPAMQGTEIAENNPERYGNRGGKQISF